MALIVIFYCWMTSKAFDRVECVKLYYLLCYEIVECVLLYYDY